MHKFEDKSTDVLFEIIASINTKEDCRDFFADLCTIKELKDMAQRFETAILLKKGQNYQEISAALGTSAATISRVSRCLNYGTGGYEKAIETLNKMENKDEN